MNSTTRQLSGESGRSRPSKVGMSPSIGGNKPVDQSNAPTSGFTRLGGGRAHHETPWAIVQGMKALATRKECFDPCSSFPSALCHGPNRPLPTPIPSHRARIHVDASAVHDNRIPAS
jgi:hypothetical protein